MQKSSRYRAASEAPEVAPSEIIKPLSREISVSSEKYSSLSRYVSLMFAANATLFITSKLVISGGYWFPLVACAFYVAVYGILLCPWTELKCKKVYLTAFTLAAIGSYFTIASVVYWIQHQPLATP